MSITGFPLVHIFILGVTTSVWAVRTTENTSQAPALRLFASSFNAGNILSKDCDEGDHHLWNDLSRQKLDNINSELERLATPPNDALEAKRAVADSLKVMQEELRQALAKFREVMAANQELKTSSQVTEQLASAKAWAQNVSRAAGSLRTDISAQRQKTLEEQLVSLSEASEAVLSKASALPSLDIADKLRPIQHWTDKVLPMMTALLPNVWTQEGQSLAAAFLKSIKKVTIVEKKLTSEVTLDKFKEKVTASQESLGLALRRKHANLSMKLEADVNRVIQDLEAMGQDQEVSTSSHAHADSSDFTNWVKGTEAAVEKLLSASPISLDRKKVKTQLFVQKFKAAFHCNKAWSKKNRHYDTMLFVYANPWSKWTISPIEWFNSECANSHGGSRAYWGCSIDNNQGLECGKAVNVMLLQASHPELKDPLRICALNTHLSFEGEAGARMENMRAAMEQTERARCDSVVFVGDFNTRLHCQAGSETTPLYERSVNAILNKFCNEESCELGNSKEDEMLHILNEDTVKCLEMNSNKKMPWTMSSQSNSLKRFRLREAAPVQFPPTYKLMEKGTKKCFGVKQRCFGLEKKCICNKSGKSKHNPAWTDRVLMAGNNVRLETTSYERRVPDKIDSDHAIVAARITVTPQR
eukprot:TRINITY_DN9355_c0_g1_i1.p1 TRINITY_DN9355_c0_g1~~TRINITY_DN9355_c0_g1_i1.p1  ORF type:complete len:666 (+),score=130.94 TRINITY_DN9355_c0_g1_i1:75-2000(+)